MKKAEKYIYLVIILILVVVVACAITYALTISKNNNESNNEQINNNNSNENENNEEEKITLSNEELEEYLSYVPFEAYTSRTITVNDISDNELINYIASRMINDYFDNQGVYANIPTEEIYNNFVTQYNREITFVSSYEYNYEDVYCFEHVGEYFRGRVCGGPGLGEVVILDSYIANDKELIIESYAVRYNNMPGQDQVFDLYTNNSISTNLIKNDDSEWLTDELVKNYINGHKSEFTKYKHTFKKNNTGYYWYSTEVV